jgi:hypothetical protein
VHDLADQIRGDGPVGDEAPLINMLGAAVSHLLSRDTLDNLIAPLAFAAITLTSWALRPPSRTLADPALPKQRRRPT